ncbi:MAG: xylose isomerase, partial [Candidatus Latescibacterota bacterium]|nr:xylose isomerase [Candidatus Latescibacterota bacterium]
AFKDLIKQRGHGRADQGTRKTGVVRLGTGFGDWPALIKTLKAIKFDGPVSFHSEYSGESVETVTDLCRIDVRFIDELWKE